MSSGSSPDRALKELERAILAQDPASKPPKRDPAVRPARPLIAAGAGGC